LTGLLLPLLRRASASRVVTVSSVVHRAGRIRLDDWEEKLGTRGGSPTPSRSWPTSSSPASCSAAPPLPAPTCSAVAAHPGYGRTNLSSAWPPSTGWERNSATAFSPSPITSVPSPSSMRDHADVGPDDYWGPDGFLERRGWPKRARRGRAARDGTRLGVSGDERKTDRGYLQAGDADAPRSRTARGRAPSLRAVTPPRTTNPSRRAASNQPIVKRHESPGTRRGPQTRPRPPRAEARPPPGADARAGAVGRPRAPPRRAVPRASPRPARRDARGRR